jgi:hypothetical protein
VALSGHPEGGPVLVPRGTKCPSDFSIPLLVPVTLLHSLFLACKPMFLINILKATCTLLCVCLSVCLCVRAYRG